METGEPRAVLALTAAVGLVGVAVVARRVQQSWGATSAEAAGVLPGDEILGPADLVATRAVTVHAPPDDVWPWLAQLGQGRGGFYSYDRLQSLLGLDIRNAEEIVPEWQDLAPGDPVRLAAEVRLRAEVVEPGRALVLVGAPDGDEATAAGDPMPFGFTWAFVLRAAADGGTRLLVRERYSYRRPWSRLVVEAVQLASFVMTERMLRGVRERAERRPPALAVS